MAEMILINEGTLPKAILAAALSSGQKVRAIYDDDSTRWGQTLQGVPFAGSVTQAQSTGLPAVIACESPGRQRELVNQIKLPWATVIHPFATLNPSAKIGPGTVILAGAVLQPDVVLGAHSLVGANAVLAHDTRAGDYVRLAAGVMVAGSVMIADGAWLQIGACVIPYVQIGAWSTLAPRAIAIRNVPDRTVVAGLPASPIRPSER